MAASEFHHYGVPTTEKHEGENYFEGVKVHGTDPEQHPYRVEFLRFDADCPLPEPIRTKTHAAFVVPDLDAALQGQKVILEPFDVTENLRCAFIMDGDAVIELMQRL